MGLKTELPTDIQRPKPLKKSPTGIKGFDEITRGGLPCGRTSVLQGGPGSGKTLFALQALVNGARLHGEPGIFVAFEENSKRIIDNASKFGWDLQALQESGLFFLDAQPDSSMIQSGNFDLGGMLAALDAKVRQMGARRIVFDSLDVVLALLENEHEVRREIYRLNDWLLAQELTSIITVKMRDEGWGDPARMSEFMPFMVDCAVILKHKVEQGISQRNIRVAKYRGSGYEENESPFVIDDCGIEVAFAHGQNEATIPVTTERITSGVARLDKMLGGGYFRGASILITGAPGTAKTTLCGTFAEAACVRSERTLFVSFDSRGDEVIRNLKSVGVDLATHTKSGILKLVAARGINGSAEIHFMHIKRWAMEHKARCVVVDPLSTLSKSGNATVAHSVVERLIDWTKMEGITLLCTSLLERSRPESEATPLEISTIADTWIYLKYLVVAGERNRAISIIKSRGTGHSNQVRELILSDKGIDVEDVYMAGGEVLMGTMRYAKERSERLAATAVEAEVQRKQRQMELEMAALEAKSKALEREIAFKRAEMSDLGGTASKRIREEIEARGDIRELRRADDDDSEAGANHE